jgi:protein import protein ZIM17
MLKRIVTSFIAISRLPKKGLIKAPFTSRIQFPPRFAFSTENNNNIPTVTTQDLSSHTTTAKVGDEEIEMLKTDGAISIMDKVPGVKAENGELYVLSFTCNQCQTRSIRSFTKHAYHKGVVMVRCGGCEGIHLVADNIGWFDDKPINVETMHEGKVKRIKDPLAISQFLNKAFNDDKVAISTK